MIYLDNAATTYPKPEAVYRALDKANREMAFNAGRGSYTLARKATECIDNLRTKLLKLVCAPIGSSVVLAPSITVALNQILCGMDFGKKDTVYVSPYEHNAVARVVSLLQKRNGVKVVEMPLIADTGEMDLEKLGYMMVKDKPSCVCCIHVSNVTGYVLPVKQVFELAKQHGAITVLDTAQSLGIENIDCKEVKADYIAFAGHKTLYGPLGIGGFINTRRNELRELIVGGTGSNSLNPEMPNDSPGKYEAGSANIVAVAGLSAALDEINIVRDRKHEGELLEYLCRQLQKNKKVTMYLPPEDNHVGMISFNLRGYKADEVGMILDQDFDIAVRSGYHCAPWIHKHLKDEEYNGTVRVGVGRYTTERELETLVSCLAEI